MKYAIARSDKPNPSEWMLTYDETAYVSHVEYAGLFNSRVGAIIRKNVLLAHQRELDYSEPLIVIEVSAQEGAAQ